MTLGRSVGGAIKIKTAGGLRAVSCGCCNPCCGDLSTILGVTSASGVGTVSGSLGVSGTRNFEYNSENDLLYGCSNNLSNNGSYIPEFFSTEIEPGVFLEINWFVNLFVTDVYTDGCRVFSYIGSIGNRVIDFNTSTVTELSGSSFDVPVVLGEPFTNTYEIALRSLSVTLTLS